MHEVNLLSVEKNSQPVPVLKLKQIVESLLFASAEPLSLSKIQKILASERELAPAEVRRLLDSLREDYESSERSFLLGEVAGGWVLRTRKEYASYVQQLSAGQRSLKLSQAATEVLAIVAYKQPITRLAVDALRGVESSGVIYALLERQLIQTVGRASTPGKPALYGTTKRFLRQFGLRNLKDLPRIADLRLETLPSVSPQASKF